MANINDYLLWRGDIPITEDYKFNEIDSMILSRVSYLRFDKIDLDPIETLESASKKMKHLSNDEFLYNGDKELITYLGKSIRFKNMQVTDYEKTNNKELEKQFGAITIHISEDELYISYLGTDSTITGWKEDFNMSFMKNVPCQIDGKKYAEKIAKKYPNKKIRIGGHSKGGNVAIYSTIASGKDIQDRIIKVYNYDGPGFNEDIINEYENLKIIDKMETYLPQESIIGRILNHKEKTTIVLSTAKGLYQHDIYSWQVLGTDLIKQEKNTKKSENVNRALTGWLKDSSPEQRQIFFDSVFELFESTEANTFGDISKALTVNIPRILKKYNEITPEDKKTMRKMITLFTKLYMEILMENGSGKLTQMKEKFKDFWQVEAK